MLYQFHVENLGLMKTVTVDLGPGFTVFTGETGAGKSMLVDALGILLGDRAASEFIRHGEEKALVEGIFVDLAPETKRQLDEAGFALEEGQLFLSRELNLSGRNICRIQGRIVPLSLYRTLCENLVDIHGQSDHQTLFLAHTHRDLLDGLGGEAVAALLGALKGTVASYKDVLAREKKLLLSEADRARQQDLLNYQIGEIEEIAPEIGEEEALNSEKKKLNNAEKIISLVAESYGELYEGVGEQSSAHDLLGQVRKNLGELARLDEACAPLLEQLETVYYTVEDVAEQLGAYQDDFDYEPGRLDEIETRLVQLSRLHKYGAKEEEVLARQEQMKAELEEMTHCGEELEKLGQLKKKLLADYEKTAQQLSAKRREAGAFLENELVGELADLGMKHGRIEVRYTPVSEPNYGGGENVEFYFSANLGEPFKPLAKVASGGEMARLMLALKSILSRFEKAGTFIFDEVDSGVGGTTIQRVGEKLARIAKSRQVFCITHSPYVAAYADRHFRIYKKEIDGRTLTQVEAMAEAERIGELTRMLGGDGEISRRHAEELRKRNAKK